MRKVINCYYSVISGKVLLFYANIICIQEKKMSGLRTNGPSNSPRLEREIVTMKKCPPSGISCYPKDDAQKNVLSASKYTSY